MNYLEEIGLLEKTHISSGRVPSEKGYRYYVDNLMELETLENYKAKLLERLEKIKEEVEFKEEDILKEILLFTDKSDISEEISRLDSHLTQLKLEMNSSEIAIGKKIDFILQEIFRELNTTGVKCNLYDISKLVVESKNELEKIREQAMNIE